MTETTLFNVPAGLAMHADAVRLTFHGPDAPLPPVVAHYPRRSTNPFERPYPDSWSVDVHPYVPDDAESILSPVHPVFGHVPRRIVTFQVPAGRRMWDFLSRSIGAPYEPGHRFSVEIWTRHELANGPWTDGEPWTYLVFPRVQVLDHGSELTTTANISRFTCATLAADQWGTGEVLPDPVPMGAHSALRLVHTVPPAPDC